MPLPEPPVKATLLDIHVTHVAVHLGQPRRSDALNTNGSLNERSDSHVLHIRRLCPRCPWRRRLSISSTMSHATADEVDDARLVRTRHGGGHVEMLRGLWHAAADDSHLDASNSLLDMAWCCRASCTQSGHRSRDSSSVRPRSGRRTPSRRANGWGLRGPCIARLATEAALTLNDAQATPTIERRQRCAKQLRRCWFGRASMVVADLQASARRAYFGPMRSTKLSSWKPVLSRCIIVMTSPMC